MLLVDVNALNGSRYEAGRHFRLVSSAQFPRRLAMAIKTIMAGLSGGTASNGAGEIACRLAARFGAHLTALHVRPDVSGMVFAAGAEGLAAAAAIHWTTDAAESLAARQAQVEADFAATAHRHRLSLATSTETSTSPRAAWEEQTGDVSRIIAARARFFDLVVLGRSDRVIDAPYSDVIEQTLIRSGRPVLLAPAAPPEALGETVAFAWNGSAQAVRGLVAAFPFLLQATQTLVITVGDDGATNSNELLDYLRRHGIGAALKQVKPVAGAGLGGQLLSAAREEGADLLALGGYGQAPWRQALFGGTTNELVGVSLLPLLLAH
jgi:nucleotide-binding universal stress UspA family protein